MDFIHFLYCSRVAAFVRWFRYQPRRLYNVQTTAFAQTVGLDRKHAQHRQWLSSHSRPYHHTWYSDEQRLNSTRVGLSVSIPAIPCRFLTPCLLPTPQLSDPSTTEAKPTAVTATATYHDSHPTSNNTSLVFSIFVFYATTNHAHDNTSYSRQCFSRRQNAFLAALNSIVYGVLWRLPSRKHNVFCVWTVTGHRSLVLPQYELLTLNTG